MLQTLFQHKHIWFTIDRTTAALSTLFLGPLSGDIIGDQL